MAGVTQKLCQQSCLDGHAASRGWKLGYETDGGELHHEPDYIASALEGLSGCLRQSRDRESRGLQATWHMERWRNGVESPGMRGLCKLGVTVPVRIMAV